MIWCLGGGIFWVRVNRVGFVVFETILDTAFYTCRNKFLSPWLQSTSHYWTSIIDIQPAHA
jgi:hypothetical protein